MSEKEGLPSVISMSAEAYRMFKAMCREEGDDRGSTKKEAVFDNYGQAFLLSVALGIANNERMKVEGEKHWLVRSEYLSGYYEPYRQLLKSRFSIVTDKEIVDAMVEFAEAGIRTLYDEFRKTGAIDFARLSALS